MKSRILLLFICFTASVFAIVLLNAFSFRVNARENGFVRQFPPHLVTPIKLLDMGASFFYPAGVADGKIYFGNSVAPDYVFVSSLSLSDTQSRQLDITHRPVLTRGTRMLWVDSSSLYLLDGASPSILYGHYPRLALTQTYPSPRFSFGIPLSPRTFLIRSFYNRYRQNILEKINAGDDSATEKYVLEKRGDGIFSTDGMLRYEPTSGSIVYIYFYRNTILRLDTNLHVIYQVHTIDTVSYGYVSPSYIPSEKTLTLDHPPVIVNKESCVSGDWILVRSGLRATNEEEEEFDKYSVIDVYSFKDGKYHFSFYLAGVKGIPVSSFFVYRQTLFVLYDHYLFAYQMNF